MVEELEHLTGVKSNVTAQQFYEVCLRGKLSMPTCKVVAIFSKHYKTEIYENCTYMAKDFEISKLPNHIKNLLGEKLQFLYVSAL